MGREIRKVPPHWEHPRQVCPNEPWRGGCNQAKRSDGMCYIPMFDKDFETATREWKQGFLAWENGTHEDLKRHPEYRSKYEYWQWDGDPPDADSYRPKFDQKPTWFQGYETVSEWTPVTPPFATKEELIDYLVQYGDFWDQYDGGSGWSIKNATLFVEREWAPLLSVVRSDDGIEIKSPRDGA